MASIPKSQAETDAETAQAALVAAANQRFIDAADAQIQEAIDQGRFYVNCETFEENLSPRDVYEYYAALGYQVTFPDFSHHDLSQQPAQLFGWFWLAFWNNTAIPANTKLPLRIILGWR